MPAAYKTWVTKTQAKALLKRDGCKLIANDGKRVQVAMTGDCHRAWQTEVKAAEAAKGKGDDGRRNEAAFGG